MANANDADVQRVIHARQWPSSVAEYRTMMEEKSEGTGEKVIKFTSKGDDELVTKLFYRVCFGLGTSFGLERELGGGSRQSANCSWRKECLWGRAILSAATTCTLRLPALPWRKVITKPSTQTCCDFCERRT